MAPHRNNFKNGISSLSSMLSKEELLEKYLKEFRVDQCPLFLQHKCQQHRPYTCFLWHFQNQRRRRPLRRRDGTFNYSADVYCSKYDETTGLCPDGDECPFLHRTAGDTERRYHLKYYKTGICVHDTDNRGFCVKNGPHCAFAHGNNDLRPPVYDIRELQAIENGEVDPVIGLNSLDKERSLVNDDPKWLDTTYVLAHYKTEPCKKPPRLCRQGYACPQFHNAKDKRRSPKKFKYRSTPCPQVKSADEWGDPQGCESGEGCQYCHTRTEQQFHPEIYKSTKCNDIQNTSYCPRGAFCAFAHIEQETVSLESPSPDNSHHGMGQNFGDILSQVLPLDDQKSHNGGQHEPSELNGSSSSSTSYGRHAPVVRNGSITPPFEENGVASPIDGQKSNNASSSSSSSTSSSGSSNLLNNNNNNSSNMNNNVNQMSQQQLINQQQQQLLLLQQQNAKNNGSGGSSIHCLSTSVDNGSQQNGFTTGKYRFLSGDLAGREAMIRRQLLAIENNPSLNPMEKLQRKTGLMMEMTSSNGGSVNNFASNPGHNIQYQSFMNMTAESMDSLAPGMDDLSLVDPFEVSKSRKSSGFSDASSVTNLMTNAGGSKSRQCSGYKSRNCSGNSLNNFPIASLTSSSSNHGNGTNPVMIPGSAKDGSPANGHSPSNSGLHHHHQQLPFVPLQQQLHGDNSGMGGGAGGLFDLASANGGGGNINNNNNNSPPLHEITNKDLEIARLREELNESQNRLAGVDEGMKQAAAAYEAWKREVSLAAKKADIAVRERETAMAKVAMLQKEVEELSGGPHLHTLQRVAELASLPADAVKALEWQLRKDLEEVEKVLLSCEGKGQQIQQQQQNQGSGNGSAATTSSWGPAGPAASNGCPSSPTAAVNQNNQRNMFDFGTTSGEKNVPGTSSLWGGGALGLLSQQHSVFGSLAK